jgi:DNA-binding NarL/FixJ family response regulator
LIVEDNKIVQRFLVSYLEPLGCCHQVADDGVEALELHERGDWQLIFMDFEMPRLKGTEVSVVLFFLFSPNFFLLGDSCDSGARKGVGKAGCDYRAVGQRNGL